MIEDRQPLISRRKRDPVTGNVITTYDHLPGWTFVDVPCSDPTAKQVEKWFEESGRNTRHGPVKRERQDYRPPDLAACENVARQLAGLEVWKQPRPTLSPAPTTKDWWGAARDAWVAGAFAWKDFGKQPARINDGSAVVHFVCLALSHFGMAHSKGAVADALRFWKAEAEKHTKGVLAKRGGGLIVATTNLVAFDELSVTDPLPTRTGAHSNKPTAR